MSEHKDYIVRALAAQGQLRIYACVTTGLVEEAREIHDTSPVATAALGRLLTAGCMMGSMLKSDQDILTLQINGDGPIGGITVTADLQGVRGYVKNPSVMLPPNDKGKLDVAGAVGKGMLNVIRDMGLKEPYNGQTPLVSGEIAEDLTYYFASSEQIPSSVGLGVLMDKRVNRVRQAGGFIIQVMPFAQETVISAVEKRLTEVTSVTDMLEDGKDPEGMIRYLMEGLEVELLDTLPAAYRCRCSRQRVATAISSIGSQELEEMIKAGEPVKVHCEFCGSDYVFDIPELTEMLERPGGYEESED